MHRVPAAGVFAICRLPRQTLLWILIGALTTPSLAGSIAVRIDSPSPQVEFAADRIRQAARQTSPQHDWTVRLRLATPAESANLQPEGFRITRRDLTDRSRLVITAPDPAGLMYGGLEAAEVIGALGIEQSTDTLQNPYMAMRGTKFNIPLDVRTPSYTDVCDAAQRNIPQMWDLAFWKEYIDNLAQYRYNYVSLWNLHPFPSLVRVPDYPDVALDDVWRSNIEWEEHYPLQGLGFVTDEILSDVEVVKKMTIDQKIDFWRRVMAYGKSRNVDFYVVTWNVFTYGTGGRYGITDAMDNPTTVDYFRKSVRQLLLTYPDLAGVGLTTGENMHGAGFQQKEDWAMATYGQGVLDAAQRQPDRKITLIHRQHQAKATDIARTFAPLIKHPSIDFIFSFKYAKAHVYSATTQPYHDAFVQDLGDMETIWTLRNDDVYYFRWGGADFVRRFVQNIPRDVSRGYYYGSDQYIWGREFLQRRETDPPLEIVKHWFQWLLWGRMAYNPGLDNTRLQAIVAQRFDLPADTAATLFDAWQNASMIYPTTTGFHWGALDFQWYIEGCQSRPSYAQNETGFHDVNRFIDLPPHKMSGFQSIPNYLENPRPADKLTPPQVADRLERHARQAHHLAVQIDPRGHVELTRTLDDIRTVAQLGLYYADKIRGATRLAAYRQSQKPADQAAAVEHLVNAARHWADYTHHALKNHKNPLWTNRVGHVDWKDNYQHALQDIRIAGGDPAGHDLPKKLKHNNELVTY
ncbi:MAG: beta-N-acetylhexosaminidase family protein [Planctomycetota bacterium]